MLGVLRDPSIEGFRRAPRSRRYRAITRIFTRKGVKLCENFALQSVPATPCAKRQRALVWGPSRNLAAPLEPVLTAAALQIVQQLIGPRLANVDKGAAALMISRDFGYPRCPEWRYDRASTSAAATLSTLPLIRP
jgi:hypothetical protein